MLWMYHILNHSPLEEYFGCFQFGAVAYRAAVKILV